MKLKVVTEHHGKKARAGASSRPIEVAVLRFARKYLLTVGQHQIETHNALCRKPQHTATPTKSALQQVTTERDIGRVTNREKQPAFSKRPIKINTPTTGPDSR